MTFATWLYKNINVLDFLSQVELENFTQVFWEQVTLLQRPSKKFFDWSKSFAKAFCSRLIYSELFFDIIVCRQYQNMESCFHSVATDCRHTIYSMLMQNLRMNNKTFVISKTRKYWFLIIFVNLFTILLF